MLLHWQDHHSNLFTLKRLYRAIWESATTFAKCLCTATSHLTYTVIFEYSKNTHYQNMCMYNEMTYRAICNTKNSKTIHSEASSDTDLPSDVGLVP